MVNSNLQTMILLDKYALITPDPGLVFWTTLVFVILWILLGKFAFKPIASALKAREESIDNALQEAEKARDEMKALQADNQKLLDEAKEERNRIIKEANEVKDSIVSDAKEAAKKEATKVLEDARAEIENQKQSAIADLKNQAGLLAVNIAEKIIKKELDDNTAQQDFVQQEIQDFKLN